MAGLLPVCRAPLLPVQNYAATKPNPSDIRKRLQYNAEIPSPMEYTAEMVADVMNTNGKHKKLTPARKHFCSVVRWAVQKHAEGFAARRTFYNEVLNEVLKLCPRLDRCASRDQLFSIVKKRVGRHVDGQRYRLKKSTLSSAPRQPTSQPTSPPTSPPTSSTPRQPMSPPTSPTPRQPTSPPTSPPSSTPRQTSSPPTSPPTSSTPTQSAEPTSPATSSAPTQPVEPTSTTSPATSSAPTQPAEPMSPATASAPRQPAEPTTPPMSPATSSAPRQPTSPPSSTPTQPASSAPRQPTSPPTSSSLRQPTSPPTSSAPRQPTSPPTSSAPRQPTSPPTFSAPRQPTSPAPSLTPSEKVMNMTLFHPGSEIVLMYDWQKVARAKMVMPFAKPPVASTEPHCMVMLLEKISNRDLPMPVSSEGPWKDVPIFPNKKAVIFWQLNAVQQATEETSGANTSSVAMSTGDEGEDVQQATEETTRDNTDSVAMSTGDDGEDVLQATEEMTGDNTDSVAGGDWEDQQDKMEEGNQTMTEEENRDEKAVRVGCIVAVAYDSDWYVGEIISAPEKGFVEVNYLQRMKKLRGSFKWGARDIHSPDIRQILRSDLCLTPDQSLRKFNLSENELKLIEGLYADYVDEHIR